MTEKPYYLFLTGASGSGKTFLCKALAKKCPNIQVNYFDDIGVPLPEEMIKEFGSLKEWQRAMTFRWVEKLSQSNEPIILLEGSYNPDFVTEACKNNSIDNYKLVVVHAERSVREQRLTEERNQPELVTESMSFWAEFIKTRVEELGGVVIDTSSSNIDQNVNQILELVPKTKL